MRPDKTCWGPRPAWRDRRAERVVVGGLVLGVLAFVFESPALYVLAALVVLAGTWRMISTSR